jgi:hypothetical protein
MGRFPIERQVLGDRAARQHHRQRRFGQHQQCEGDRVGKVLETLVATGLARTGEAEGKTRYLLPR